ncbi:MAG: hypothetical protein WC080_02170 [Patescibacteria group bacterium]
MKVQKSTRTTFSRFSPWHNALRMKFGWYYKWHLSGSSSPFHWMFLTLYIVAISVLGFVMVNPSINFEKPPKALAANTTTWTVAGAGDANYNGEYSYGGTDAYGSDYWKNANNMYLYWDGGGAYMLSDVLNDAMMDVHYYLMEGALPGSNSWTANLGTAPAPSGVTPGGDPGHTYTGTNAGNTNANGTFAYNDQYFGDIGSSPYPVYKNENNSYLWFSGNMGGSWAVSSTLGSFYPGYTWFNADPVSDPTPYDWDASGEVEPGVIISEGGGGPATILISGTAKQYDESTNAADSETVKVAVNGTIQAQTGTTSGGSWSISGVTAPASGDTITVFIDGVADGNEANAVTKYDGSGNITGISLYEKHLYLGSDDNQTLSNNDISKYDNSVSSDEDIFFEIDGSNNLTLPAVGTQTDADQKIIIKANNTWRPASGGGTTSTVPKSYAEASSTMTLDNNSLVITGSGQSSSRPLRMETGSTFNYDTSTVTYQSASATDVALLGFHNLILDHSGTTFTPLSSGSFSVYGVFTIQTGTIYNGSDKTVYLYGSGTPFVVNGTFQEATSTIKYAGSSATNVTSATYYNLYLVHTGTTFTAAGNITVGSVLTLDVGTFNASDKTIVLNGSGTPFVNINATFQEGTSTVQYKGSSATNVTATTFYNLYLDRTGSTFTAAGDMTVSNLLTINAGEFDASNKTITLLGTNTPFVINGTFTANNSTLFYDCPDPVGAAVNVTATTYYNLQIARENFSGTHNVQAGTLNVSNNLHVGGGALTAVLSFETNDPIVNVDGDVIIDAGNTLTASSTAAFYLAGDYTNSATGIFTSGTGTLTLDGSDLQTITAGGTNGNHDFNSITITNASANGVYFADSATINGVFTDTTPSSKLTFHAGSTYSIMGLDINGGAVGTRIFMVSSTPTNHWNFNVVQDSPPASYVNVTDSDATGGSLVNATTGGYDGGNNHHWAFPPASISISGTCKQYDESSNCADSETIKVAINGSLDAATGTTSSGSWSITGVTAPSAGDTITIFVDGVADANEANAVTKYVSGNVSGIALYEKHLSIGSADNQTLSNADMEKYDNSVSSDEDIFFEVNATTKDLTLPESGTQTDTDQKLYVLASNTWQPAATDAPTSTISNLVIPTSAIVNLTGTTLALTASGTPLSITGTFTIGTSTIKFQGSGATNVNALSYYNLYAADKTGTTFAAAGNITVSGVLTINAGTFDASNKTITLSGSGTPFVVTGTFTPSTSTISYEGSSDTNLASVTYNNLVINHANTDFIAAGDITIADGFTMTSGSFSPGSHIINIAGDWDSSNVTFNEGNSTINFNGTSGDFSIILGSGQKFYNLTIAGENGGGSTSSTLGCGTGTNDASYGDGPWSTPEDITADDGNYARIVGIPQGKRSNYLKATNFGFNIPTNATVTGIKMEAKRMGSSPPVSDDIIEIIKSGTIGGTNQSADALWSGTEDYVPFGGDGNLWGLTWTPNDVNDSSFGVAMTIKKITPSVSNAIINYVRGTIYYSIPSSAWSLSSNIDVTNNLLVSSGTLTAGAHDISAGNVTISGGSLSAPASSNNFIVNGNWNHSSGTFDNNSGTVTFQTGGADKTLSGNMTGGSAFNNLTFNDGSGIWTANNDIDVSGVLSITTGEFNASNKTITLSGSGTPFVNNGTFQSSTSTIKYTGASATNVTAMGSGMVPGYYNLYLDHAGTTFTAAGNIKVENIFTINAGTFDASNKTITFMSTGTPFVVTGTFTASTSTVEYYGAAATNIASTTYYNLHLVTTAVSTAMGDINVTNVLTNDSIFDASNKTITLSGSGTPFVNNVVFTPSTSTVKYTGSLATNITATTYYNLYLDRAGTIFSAAGDITSTNVFTVNAGTFNDSPTGTITLSGSGTPFVINGTFQCMTGTVKYTGASATNIASTTYNNLYLDHAGTTFTAAGDISTGSNGTGVFTINAGTFDASNKTITLSGTSMPFVKTGTFTASTSTVKYTGTGPVNVTSATYYNLYIDKAGQTYTAAGDITANNVLTINAGTFNASNKTITLSGSGTPFVATGTFTYSTSTIKYTGSSATNITPVTYYNLTAEHANTNFTFTGATSVTRTFTNTTAPSTLTFNSGSNYNFNYAINIAGTSGNLITLAPSGGANWNLSASNNVAISYANVSKSSNTGSFCATYSVDGGGNTGWNISLTGSCSACSSYTFSGAGDSSYNGSYTYASVDARSNPYYTNTSNRVLAVDPWDSSWYLLSDTSKLLAPADQSAYVDWGSAGAPTVLPTTGTWTSFNGTLPAPTVTSGCSSFSISGTCKQYDESTACADGETVKVAINGTLDAATGTTASGSWTISGVTEPSAGDVITVFIDGATESHRANAVTKYTSGDITGVTLFEQHLVVGNGTAQTLSNTDLSQYDGSVSSDADILFDIGNATNDLAMPYNQATLTSQILYVIGTDTWRPNSSSAPTSTIPNLKIPATAVVNLDNTTLVLTESGDPLSISGTFTESTSTVKFQGTSATNINAITYCNLYAADHTGTTFTAAGNITINGVLTINAGTFAASSRTITLAAPGTPLVVTGTFQEGTSTLKYTGALATNITATTYYNLYLDHAGTTFTAAGDITTTNILTINAGTFDASNRTITLTGSGTPFVKTGTFTASTSTFIYRASSNTNITAANYYNLELLDPAVTPYVWVTNSGSNNITKLNSSTGAVIGTYAVGTGPYGVAVDGSGNVWVGNPYSGNVTKLNGSTGALIGTYAVGGGNPGVDNAGNVWVPYDSSHINKVNGSTGAVMGTYSTGTSPSGVAADRSGNVWICNHGSGNVTKLDSSTGALIGTYSVNGAPFSIAVDGDGNVWTASDGDIGITKLNGSTGAVIDIYSVPGANLAVDGSGNVWVVNSGTVYKVNGSTGAVIGTYSIGNGDHPGIDGDGNVWVTSIGGNTITKLNGSTGAVIGTYNVGSGPYHSFGDMTGFIWQSFVGNKTLTLSSGSFGVTNNLTIGDGTNQTDVDGITNNPSMNIGNFILNGNASFSAPSTMSVSGGWNHAGGIFTPGSGTVTLTGDSLIEGDTTFNNLTAATAGKTLSFSAGSTQTISGTWTVTGTSGSHVVLKRSGGSGGWNINPATATISYATISNSTNSGASFCATYSTDGGSNTDWNISPTGSCVTAPSAPTNAAIGTIQNDSFQVTWDDNSSDETGFKVYISTTPNSDCSQASYPDSPDYTTGAGETSQDVDGKDINTQYCAKVVAFNDAGNSTSAYSSPKYTLANMPTVSTVAGAYFVTGTISPSLNPSGTNYWIQYSINGTDFTDPAGMSWQTSTSYTLANLDPNTQYWIKAKARNGDNTDTTYSPSSAKVTPPAAPASLEANAVCRTSANLTWIAPEGADKYTLSYGTDSGASNKGTISDISTTATSLSGLARKTKYYAKVSATSNQNGAGNYSAIINFTTANCLGPTPSTDFRGTDIVTSQINWVWSNTDDDHTSWAVLDAAGNPLSGTLAASASSWLEQSLAPNTAYTRQVTVTNRKGTEKSNFATSYTLANTPDAPILSVVSESSVKIAINQNGNPANTRYAIYNDTAGKYVRHSDGAFSDSPDWQLYADWGGSDGFINTGLAASTNYAYRLKARNNSNVETDFSTASEVTTLGNPEKTASYIIISPTSAKIKVEDSVQFSAKAFASDDSEIPTAIIVWSVMNGGGEIDQTGLFTAGKEVGSFENTVQASFGDVKAAASVNVRKETIGEVIIGGIVGGVEDVAVSIDIVAGGIEKVYAAVGISKEAAPPVTAAAALGMAVVVAGLAPATNLITLFSLKEVIHIIVYSILSFGTVKKKRKKWGQVLEDGTGLPLSGAMVSLIKVGEDGTERVIETTTTDKSGVYGFAEPPGKYKIIAKKDKYQLAPKPDQYYDFDTGKIYEIDSYTKGFLVPTIIMSINGKSLSGIHAILGWLRKMERFFNYASIVVLTAGTILVLNNLIHDPNLLNYLILAGYILLWVINFSLVIRKSPWSMVVDRHKGEPIGLTLVRIMTGDNTRLVKTAVTDDKGKFSAILKRGRYTILATKEGYTLPKPVRFDTDEEISAVNKKIEMEKRNSKS